MRRARVREAAMFRRSSFPAAVLGALLLVASATRAADIGYDPKADPFAIRAAAVKEAQASDKLVLLVSGGDWCIWCHYLYEFIDANDDVDAALHDVFVVAKVYVGSDNMNDKFFATLPKADGAPHFWILASDGELLESQPTVVLEDGKKSYDKAALMSFIGKWRERAAR
jgi:thioredoxin-related protein